MATQIPILFFNEKITFTLRDKIAVRTWLASILKTEGHKLNHINYIFCTDKYLHKINLQYLQHNTYTDIITFNNSNLKGTAEADIFISIQRVKENAKTLKINFTDELHRIMAHGILHLCGYQDKTPKHKLLMTGKEDYYLSLRPFL